MENAYGKQNYIKKLNNFSYHFGVSLWFHFVMPSQSRLLLVRSQGSDSSSLLALAMTSAHRTDALTIGLVSEALVDGSVAHTGLAV